MSGKRLSMILRNSASPGETEAKEVPTPYGGVYRRQNYQKTNGHEMISHNNNRRDIEESSVVQQAHSASRGVAARIKKSNRAGRQTRKVMSRVDKLLPLMHNLLGALQADGIEPRPYVGRRDTWAPTPSSSNSTLTPRLMMNEEEDTKVEESGDVFLETPPPPLKPLLEKSSNSHVRRGTFVQLGDNDEEKEKEKDEEKVEQEKQEEENNSSAGLPPAPPAPPALPAPPAPQSRRAVAPRPPPSKVVSVDMRTSTTNNNNNNPVVSYSEVTGGKINNPKLTGATRFMDDPDARFFVAASSPPSSSPPSSSAHYHHRSERTGVRVSTLDEQEYIGTWNYCVFCIHFLLFIYNNLQLLLNIVFTYTDFIETFPNIINIFNFYFFLFFLFYFFFIFF